jgi:hypothetical protein
MDPRNAPRLPSFKNRGKRGAFHASVWLFLLKPPLVSLSFIHA